MKFIPKFEAEDGTTVEFRPVNDVPGFTHRVIINGVAVRDWLGRGKPSADAARFFFDKHAGALPRSGKTLREARQRQADGAFEAYDFGQGVNVEGVGGWETTTPGREMSRAVFFKTDEARPEDASRIARFTVVFQDATSSVIVSAMAFTLDGGNVLGPAWSPTAFTVRATAASDSPGPKA